MDAVIIFFRMPGAVLIVPYDPNWPIMFERLRGCLSAAVGDLAVAIEQVGSTAVPGLASKPILDIDIVVRSEPDVGEVIVRLGEFGYNHRGDLGIRGREAFHSPRDIFHHHLYLVAQDSEPLRNHIRFRDYLRANPRTAEDYQRLKQALAEFFRDDREGYTNGKAEFVQDVLRRASETLSA
jgi:GrpB-like predicted nucleotidyltransferase (UPF0157 family)